VAVRVAKLHTKNHIFVNLEGLGIETLIIFYDLLVFYRTYTHVPLFVHMIWYAKHVVVIWYFFPFWYVVPRKIWQPWWQSLLFGDCLSSRHVGGGFLILFPRDRDPRLSTHCAKKSLKCRISIRALQSGVHLDLITFEPWIFCSGGGRDDHYATPSGHI
jgi:hypothetical protein